MRRKFEVVHKRLQLFNVFPRIAQMFRTSLDYRVDANIYNKPFAEYPRMGWCLVHYLLEKQISCLFQLATRMSRSVGIFRVMYWLAGLRACAIIPRKVNRVCFGLWHHQVGLLPIMFYFYEVCKKEMFKIGRWSQMDCSMVFLVTKLRCHYKYKIENLVYLFSEL